MFSNNGCPECVERLDEGIILVLNKEAQGAYCEAQGVDFEAQGAYFEAQGAYLISIIIGGKAHTCKTWIVKRKIMNLI